MKRIILFSLSLVISTGAVLAGPATAGEMAKLKKVEAKRNFEKIVYALPGDARTKRELTVYQALAAAITQTVVLKNTRTDRWLNAENPRKKITLRGNRMTMSYSRNLYEQHCYLAVGPIQKWRTVNGFWAARNVNARALKRAIDILKKNGVHMQTVSISVSDNRNIKKAQRMLQRIGLGDVAIVGYDPDKPNHATVKLNNTI